MIRRTTGTVVAILGLAMTLVGGLGAPGSAADPDVCVYGAARAAEVSTTVVHDGGCPTLPPDRSDPCPDGVVWIHEWQDSTNADYDVMVCVGGL